VIEAVGLGDRQAFLPRDLSGGQSSAWRSHARSPATRRSCSQMSRRESRFSRRHAGLELFRALAKRENRALVIVTHDPKVRAVADRVVKIHDGRLSP